MRLLLVEDDRMIGDSLRGALKLEGYAVDWVRDAAAAQATLASERFDLILLDLGLPAIGAPHAAVLRRHAGRGQSAIVVGNVTLDPTTRQVARDGMPVLLSAREFAVLEALM